MRSLSSGDVAGSHGRTSPPTSRRRIAPARRRLEAARLAGAGVIATFGQIAVDLPGGSFGSTGVVTPTGAGFAGAVVVLVIAGCLALLRPSARASLPARLWRSLGSASPLLLVALVVGAFLPAAPSDPMIAGGVLLWSVAYLSRLLFPLPEAPRPVADDPLSRWQARSGPAAVHILVVSLVVTTAALGYRVGGLPARLYCLLLGAVSILVALPGLRRMAEAGRRRAYAPALLLLIAAAVAARPSAALGLFASAEVLVLVLLFVSRPLATELAESFSRRPTFLVVASFAPLSAFGALFLGFPAASQTGRPIAAIDALFTSTSAVCVTGLIVLDTPHDFSRFGQIVLLVLIQVGGLNIMVLSAFGAVVLGRSLGLRAEQAMADVLDLGSGKSGSAYALIAFVVVTTLACELVGAAVLASAYVARGTPWSEALWLGLFHSVSAFCNAGFALHSDSLASFRSDPSVLLTIAALIIAGGLGFSALAASWAEARSHVGSRPRRGLPVQVRLVMALSTALVVGGTGLFLLCEWDRTLAGLSPGDKVLNALFQSVTLRTAGFNSVAFDVVHPATILWMMAWMFIGASPGGTGGGIKTTTTFVLLSAIPALARGTPRIVVFGRTLPLETVYRAAAIATVSLVTVIVGAALLVLFEPHGLVEALFEATSAVGTVGLSLGLTSTLGLVGKTVVTILMFLGRIGPLTLALLLARETATSLRYPEARVMVG